MPRILDKYRSPLRRLHDFAISDSVIFLILAHMFIVKSFSYYPEGLRDYYMHPFELRLDNDVIFYFWFITGVMLLTAAFYHNTLYTASVFCVAMTLLLLWGLAFLLSGNVNVAQLGLIYITLSIVTIVTVYRGRSSEYRLTKE